MTTDRQSARDPVLLILCSPSGAGKTTLSRHLMEVMRTFTFSVSHTTRAPRRGEAEGVHYNFVDRPAFEAMVRADRFLEWAEVHQNLYGTSLEEVTRASEQGHEGLVFDIDVQGARQIKARLPFAVSVFVLPPSMAELRRRLEGRATDAPAVIERRLEAARSEIEHYAFFDYLIVNDDLERSKETLVSIAQAERARTRRNAALAEALLRTGRL